MRTLARIRFGESFIDLGIDGRWRPSSENIQSLANIATRLSQPPFYDYSPAHGAFGPWLAHLVSKRIGGKVILPKVKEAKKPPPGLVF